MTLSFNSQHQAYVGGNDLNTIYNNPAFMDQMLKKLSGGKLAESCKNIPAVGKAVLSIRQLQQAVSTLLDSSNQESHAKVIFFKEYVNQKTKQLLYKVVFYFKTFTSEVFLGVETLYKPNGYPSFDL